MNFLKLILGPRAAEEQMPELSREPTPSSEPGYLSQGKQDSSASQATPNEAEPKLRDVSVVAPDETIQKDASDGVDKLAGSLQPVALNLTTKSGKWLDRNLGEIYRRALHCYEKKITLMNKAAESGAAENRDEGMALFCECHRLREVYCQYLGAYPDEIPWLKEIGMGRPCESPSESARFNMHQTLLFMTVHTLSTLESSFEFNRDVTSGYAQAFQGGESLDLETCNPVHRALSSSSLGKDICYQMELLDLMLSMTSTGLEGISFEALLGVAAQYKVNLGYCLYRLKKLKVGFQDSLQDATRAVKAIGSCYNHIDEFVMQKKREYIYTYSRDCLYVALYLQIPSSVCHILYLLTQIQSSSEEVADDKNREKIVPVLNELVLKVLSDEKARRKEADTKREDKKAPDLNPVVSAMLHLKDTGKISKLVSGSGVDELLESLEQLDDAVGRHYPAGARVLCRPADVCPPAKWKEECSDISASSQVNSQTGESKPRVARSKLMRQVLGLPALEIEGGLSVTAIEKYINTKADPDQMENLSTQALCLYARVPVKIETLIQNFKNPSELDKKWEDDVKLLLEDYEEYLKGRKEARALMRSSGIQLKLNSEARTSYTSLKSAHAGIQNLAFLYHLGVYCKTDLLNECGKQCDLVLTGKDQSIRESGLQAAIKTIRQYQQDCMAIITCRTLGLVGKYNFVIPDEKIITFIEEVCSDYIRRWYDSVVMLANIESIQAGPEAPRKRLLAKLRDEIFKGCFFQNKALIFTIYPASGVRLEEKFQEKFSLLKLVVCPDLIVESLRELDQWVYVRDIDPCFQEMLFKLVASRFQAEKKRENKERGSCLDVMQAISHSICDGWLLKHWFSYVHFCGGEPQENENLVLQVKDYHPVLRSMLLARREQQVRTHWDVEEELMNLSPQVPAKIKKQTTQSFTRPSEKYQKMITPVAEASAFTPALSDEDRLFNPIEACSKDDPARVIREMADIIEKYSRNLHYRMRARTAQAQVAVTEVTSALDPLIYLKSDAVDFSRKFEESMQPPFTFTDNQFYGEMIVKFQTIPRVCSTFTERMKQYHQYIVDFRKLSEDLLGQDGGERILWKECGVVLEKIAEAEDTINWLKKCVEQRSDLTRKRSKYLDENPSIVVPRKNSSKRKRSQKNQEIFEKAGGALTRSSQDLEQMTTDKKPA